MTTVAAADVAAVLAQLDHLDEEHRVATLRAALDVFKPPAVEEDPCMVCAWWPPPDGQCPACGQVNVKLDPPAAWESLACIVAEAEERMRRAVANARIRADSPASEALAATLADDLDDNNSNQKKGQ